MQVIPLKYNNLYTKARIELEEVSQNTDLPELTKIRLESFLENYLELIRNKSLYGDSPFFKLKLSEYNPNLLCQLVKIAKICDKSLGNLLNILMYEYNFFNSESINSQFDARVLKPYLPETNHISIHGYHKIRISKKDLTEIDQSVSFHRINFLEFDTSISEQVFVKQVRNISNCGTVVVPNTISKIVLFGKVRACQNVVYT